MWWSDPKKCLCLFLDFHRSWVKYIAIPGLHVCLIGLVGLPIYYDRQVNRPAKRMTLDKWDAVHFRGEFDSEQHEKTLNFLQVDDKDHGIDVLHVWGNTAFLESNVTKGFLLILSILAATAYVCQYAIIKSVGTGSSFIAPP